MNKNNIHTSKLKKVLVKELMGKIDNIIKQCDEEEYSNKKSEQDIIEKEKV